MYSSIYITELDYKSVFKCIIMDIIINIIYIAFNVVNYYY